MIPLNDTFEAYRYFRENNSKFYCMNSNLFYKINELKSIF